MQLMHSIDAIKSSIGMAQNKVKTILPAFVSPNVLNFLVEKFNIAPITTPEADLAEILGGR